MRRAPIRMALWLLVLSATGANLLHAAGESLEERFRTANRLYEEGRYDEAAAGYEAIRQAGIENEKLFYNLGNAHFKRNELGLALMNWERARRLDPGDRDIRANLRFGRNLTFDRMELPEPPFPIGLLLRGRAAVSPATETLLGIALYLAGNGLLAAFLLEERRQVRKLLLYGLVVSFFGFAVVSVSLGIRIHTLRTRVEAIILADAVEVRSGPGEGQTALFTIHEGLKAEVRNERGGWLQVSLPNGWNGWIPRDSAGVI